MRRRHHLYATRPKFGARGRGRTDTVAILSRMTLTCWPTRANLAISAGFEPATYGVEIRCSIQLN